MLSRRILNSSNKNYLVRSFTAPNNNQDSALQGVEPLNWEDFLNIRKSRHRYDAIASIPTTLGGFFGGASYFSSFDPNQVIFGLFTLFSLAGITIMGCGALGWLTGPSLGTSIWKFLHKSKLPEYEIKERLFFHHIMKKRVDPARQSVQNPVPDYYGESIVSLKSYRQWLRDQATYNRKAYLSEKDHSSSKETTSHNSHSKLSPAIPHSTTPNHPNTSTNKDYGFPQQQPQNEDSNQQPAKALPSLAPSTQLSEKSPSHIPQSKSPAIPSQNSPANPDSSYNKVQPRKTQGRYTLKDFKLERTLGTGSFGRVHLVKSNHNSRFYAIKVLAKEQVVKMKQVEHTVSERDMLARVRHPFLVNLWGTFQDPKNLYMVMDFVAGGELFSLLRKSQRFPNPVAKFYAAEVALALDYLHSLDIIYRDLKPENILLGADGHIKITDFGFAKYVPDVTWTLCGTPDYLAPEIVQSKGYNKSVDWYALGVLVFEMLAGYPPFYTEDSNPMKLYEKIIANKPKFPSYFDPVAKDLLKNLLMADLTKRFGNLQHGSRDVFTHEWFKEVDWNRLYNRAIPAPYVPKIAGDGDSSQYDKYQENDVSLYGQAGDDTWGHLFKEF
ncbi:hypothetical protein E3P92_02088 [Wallemia ichthyophaga]|uniref:cAMP-dependent protein kinase n=1 Tax=Wallemia ichthyophaga TaxID=245174 RepID=A0A4T0FRT0_WALIC|nr:hypothetical protein E3P98_01790 [Wallemia ichthyophaga]TIA91000.1 hypothetical protein E3P97_02198 [Wallemia ichthyophaga]TIB00006.1 hypothetical protein E3P95_01824 [Wallemia ichthyophaga]TIB01294.1 hypothetical protein E3P94_01856 [Wallemia ichthyophaga]TIB01691.1 hypothetical protein E3P96_02320 [Wallemia ichthyophaga]